MSAHSAYTAELEVGDDGARWSAVVSHRYLPRQAFRRDHSGRPDPANPGA